VIEEGAVFQLPLLNTNKPDPSKPQQGFDMDDKKLVKKAQEARGKAYARYSNFAVGAALLAKSGKVYGGCNVENSSFGLTCCAERVALFRAVCEGEKEFDRIAVVGPEEEELFPCGACLQVLSEFAPELTVITFDGRTVRTYPLRDLLPKGFRGLDPIP
jgi:cytidine deaminase